MDAITGRATDVAVVATYHQRAHIAGLTRDRFAATIADELRQLGD